MSCGSGLFFPKTGEKVVLSFIISSSVWFSHIYLLVDQLVSVILSMINIYVFINESSLVIGQGKSEFN